MWPRPGEHLLRYVGDRFRIQISRPPELEDTARAFLRTNLTRAKLARAEVISRSGLESEEAFAFAGASWRDIPLAAAAEGFELDLALLEVGHFRAKAYCVDARGRQFWPEGGDIGISVHPDRLRTANLIYCAFPRAVGREAIAPLSRELARGVSELDERGYSVIPPSGTLRELTRMLPHIFDTLGCRILHLLPVGPVPTTLARMGRHGSPYAQLDLTGIDPALVEFDKRTTGVDQFRELADGVHLRDGLLILDIVLNHTGWLSRVMEEHPEWFKRDKSGEFHSPGAWGNTWADLVELDQRHHHLWHVLADSLITWCRRGVDGFRCDAGYMIPLPAWQYIVARVRELYPNTVFLLEGLGGAWEATENLLTAGGMQWAYSELFQCYEPRHVAEYMDHANRQSRRIGILTHYSETHDNERLAKRGASWSRVRNHLSALSSHAGNFAYTAGVEWLCTQKIDVHEARPLGFGQEPNLLAELSRLARLLREHPCFFDGAEVERLSEIDAPAIVLRRVSADAANECVVVINLELEQSAHVSLRGADWARLGDRYVDLLGHEVPAAEWVGKDSVNLAVPAAASYCLAPSAQIVGLSGDLYRERRAQAAWAYGFLAQVLPHEALGAPDFAAFAAWVAADPQRFLACLSAVEASAARVDLLAELQRAAQQTVYRAVVRFRSADARRVVLLPPEHYLLLEDTHPFELHVTLVDGERHRRSTKMDGMHVVALVPVASEFERDIEMRLVRFGQPGAEVVATVRKLPAKPALAEGGARDLVLLTNGRGGMARLYADLGRVRSKYDCLLGANLHPDVPVDRHVMVKRMRAWVTADGFITPLDAGNLASIEPGPPARWQFRANAGDGRRVGVSLSVAFVPLTHCVVLRLVRNASGGVDLPSDRQVSVTLRFDLEDRSFHQETHHHTELAQHFAVSTSTHADQCGFRFAPHTSRTLEVSSSHGAYHAAPEWTYGIEHDLDAERGQASRGDAFSPGWFELPLESDEPVTLTLSLDALPSVHAIDKALTPAAADNDDAVEAALRRAAEQFIAVRGTGHTVIAGYPWFLDWGRDTFVAARGLIAADYHDHVRSMLLTYAALERAGTLPNNLAGVGEASRETSDAPFWFALACEELAEKVGLSLYEAHASDGRSLREVLVSSAEHLLSGAPNGVSIDHESGLVYSPSHFTWMDTNYPAGSPREGYPIELSAMWLRLLLQLERLGVATLVGAPVASWVERVRSSFELFWRADLGFFADTLHAARGVPAREARADDHLRPNQLLAVSLGLVTGERARGAVEAASRFLLVPGAMRTLAPLPVLVALPIRGGSAQSLLNDPSRPYWGRYEGDEDTRRKPAYHNGTAWPWWLATYCEALVRAYDGDPRARRAARAILGSSVYLLSQGCLGQLPEVIDGDAPHQERGCDAQAWSVTETLRGWLTL
jgi:predicted glycogen debranching enzyme